MIVGIIFLLGVVVASFLPEARGKPLPHTVRSARRARE
jgi:hypothetical protein